MLKFLKQEKRIHKLKLELEAANAELEKLRLQNESMREGMRRCLTCDYRIEVLQNRKKQPSLSEKL
jgi:hypothetical protein